MSGGWCEPCDFRFYFSKYSIIGPGINVNLGETFLSENWYIYNNFMNNMNYGYLVFLNLDTLVIL